MSCSVSLQRPARFLSAQSSCPFGVRYRSRFYYLHDGFPEPEALLPVFSFKRFVVLTFYVPVARFELVFVASMPWLAVTVLGL